MSPPDRISSPTLRRTPVVKRPRGPGNHAPGNQVARVRSFFAGAVAVLMGFSRAAGQTPSTPAATAFDLKALSFPSPLTELSLTVREGYDSNVFGTKAIPLPSQANFANVATWTTVLSPKLSLDLLSWMAPDRIGFLKAVNFSYAADESVFTSAHGEDNLKNTFGLQVNGLGGPWSLLVDNSLLYVDGPRDDPFYTTYSPLGYRAARDRRDQIQEKDASILRYDGAGWFARAVANAQYYNLLINEHNPVGAYKGYLNWINRDDINAGSDFGYDLTRSVAFVAGWRLGQQTQARTLYSPADNSSTYNRALFGLEGRPLSWLQLQFTAGPDWRRYGDGSNVGLLGQRHTWLYTESSLTATASPADTFTFANKVWHWVSASGGTSYQETTDTWNYRRAFTARFSASVGFIVQGVRYDFPSVRNDWTTSYPLNLTYAFNRSISVGADFLSVRGRSKIPSAIDPGRDWNQRQIFFSIRVIR